MRELLAILLVGVGVYAYLVLNRWYFDGMRKINREMEIEHEKKRRAKSDGARVAWGPADYAKATEAEYKSLYAWRTDVEHERAIAFQIKTYSVDRTGAMRREIQHLLDYRDSVRWG